MQHLAEESLVNGLIQYDKNQGWRGVIGNLKEYNLKFEDVIQKIKRIPLSAIKAVKEFSTEAEELSTKSTKAYARNLHATINSSESLRN